MQPFAAALMMAGGSGNPLVSFAPILAMLAIMYFLLLRPQQKEARRHQEMLAALKKGDEVVTVGGLYGKILALNEERVSLRVDEGVRVEVERAKIMRVVGRPDLPAGDKAGEKPGEKPAGKAGGKGGEKSGARAAAGS
ncbi:MAG: preprotein translocase subunit YajC [Gemmatimonadetes bacterium]|nr:preprotein translocase subunit YajC [Gemmatimonadota bacterium]